MLGLRVSTPSSRARASPPTPSPTAAHSGTPLFSALGEFLPKNCSSQLHHRPVISFCMDPYVCIPSPGEGWEGWALTYNLYLGPR